jgi:hypothetical protein
MVQALPCEAMLMPKMKWVMSSKRPPAPNPAQDLGRLTSSPSPEKVAEHQSSPQKGPA